MIIYKDKNTNYYYQVRYTLPDSTQTTLMADFEKKVDFSSFLDDGKILLKVGHRFLIFNEIGDFIDETEFKDTGEENIEASN